MVCRKERSFSTISLFFTLFTRSYCVLGFSLFQEKASLRRTVPSQIDGVEIEVPNFDELFTRIQQVSPLARQAMQPGGPGNVRGFKGVDDTQSSPDIGQWKICEANKRRIIHQIDKIDDFQGYPCPIIRFRSSLKGPCSGKKFAEFIMNFEERKQWDLQIADVRQLYSSYDIEAANLAMGVGKYGDCSLLGLGYCKTKSNIITDGREQLTLCGIQDFPDGSSVIWGTEMEDWHNHLLPPCERRTRAKSHLFSTALIPTGPDTFDAEYVLQLEVGGKIPGFLGSPVVIETVRSLFRHASKVFQDEEIMAPYIKTEEELGEEMISQRQSLLMTP